MAGGAVQLVNHLIEPPVGIVGVFHMADAVLRPTGVDQLGELSARVIPVADGLATKRVARDPVKPVIRPRNSVASILVEGEEIPVGIIRRVIDRPATGAGIHHARKPPGRCVVIEGGRIPARLRDRCHAPVFLVAGDGGLSLRSDDMRAPPETIVSELERRPLAILEESQLSLRIKIARDRAPVRLGLDRAGQSAGRGGVKIAFVADARVRAGI